MRYLLDVNALIALGLEFHTFHFRIAAWIGSEPHSTYLTCSVTELGFVRVMAQVPTYATDVQAAKNLLLRLKRSRSKLIEFVSDTEDISSLPQWVKTPAQTTDGHLLHLATANSAVLATFDKGIPGAFLIP
jgi:predicted nucleic acid-binding protein